MRVKRAIDPRRLKGLNEQFRLNIEGLYVQVRLSAERAKKNIEELRTMIATMAATYHNPQGESQVQRGENGWNHDYQIPTKCSRVEFPWFNRVNLRGWVYCCAQFFDVDKTPYKTKKEYIHTLNDKFGSLLYEDPISELMNLKQTGTIQEYFNKFDELFNCVELTELYAISCLLGGLRTEISLFVKMFKPKNLQKTISLAKSSTIISFKVGQNTHRIFSGQQNFRNNQWNHSNSAPYTNNNNNQPRNISQPSKNPNSLLIPSRRLTQQEIDQKIFKSLYFWCDKKLPETINIIRKNSSSKGMTVHILIDTGSTHNFLGLQTTKRLGCKLEDTKPFPVAVADESKIYSTFVCKDFTWRMQGVYFSINMMIIPLGDYDMVLGIQWLVTQGDISWNFI
ncbi:hypothetical protein Pfo_015521 [Paulownia fortunei]|nr:hypothetical protein Pfo_015521 [Paulownia fortunei]